MLYLLFTVAFCVCVQANTDKWTHMRVKYGAEEPDSNSDYFWSIPNTLQEALDNSSFKHVVQRNDRFGCTLVGVSEADHGFMPCYDTNGWLSGAHICQPLGTVIATQPSSYSAVSYGTVEVKVFNQRLYLCSTFIWVDPATLANGRDDVTEAMGEGLWVRDTGDLETGFRKIPDDIDELLTNTLYTEQSCFPAMGNHYFYNFTQQFDCDTFYNWFLLGEEDSVSGIGFQLFGVPEIVTYDWYDFLPRVAAEIIAPNVNECLYDWIEQYGIISIHVYFQENPWTITC